MTATRTAPFRTIAFGEADGRLWGAALDAGPSGGAGLVIGDGDVRETLAGSALQWTLDGASWELIGDGVALRVQPLGLEPEDDGDNPDGDGAGGSAGSGSDGAGGSGGSTSDGEVSGVQQLCHVTGTVTIGGDSVGVDCAGTRTVIDGLQAGTVTSARGVSGWFGDEAALTLLALRPHGAQHHDDDLVAATLFDLDGWVSVADPRLSTTYADSGDPLRTSLELWIGDGDNEFPRRAAGEVSGPGAELTSGELSLRVAPLRCHSRGQDGAGVYVLARF
jgi:hypothetical protein